MLIVIPSLVILAIGVLLVFVVEAMTGELKQEKHRVIKEEIIYRRDDSIEQENEIDSKTAA